MREREKKRGNEEREKAIEIERERECVKTAERQSLRPLFEESIDLYIYIYIYIIIGTQILRKGQ